MPERYPKLMEMIALFKKRHPELISHVAPTDTGYAGYKDRRLLSILNKKKLEKVLGYLLDENEFLGPYGIRSLSRYHLDHPFSIWVGGQEYTVAVPPRRLEHGDVRRQLQLARTRLDARQCVNRSGALEFVRIFWR